MSVCDCVAHCDCYRHKLDYLDVIILLRTLLVQFKCDWGSQDKYLRDKGYCPTCYHDVDHCDCGGSDGDEG